MCLSVCVCLFFSFVSFLFILWMHLMFIDRVRIERLRRLLFELGLVSLVHWALWLLEFLFSISCAGFGTKFWFVVRLSKVHEPFQCDVFVSNSDLYGILFPIPMFDTSCMFVVHVVVIHSHLKNQKLRSLLPFYSINSTFVHQINLYMNHAYIRITHNRYWRLVIY